MSGHPHALAAVRLGRHQRWFRRFGDYLLSLLRNQNHIPLVRAARGLVILLSLPMFRFKTQNFFYT